MTIRPVITNFSLITPIGSDPEEFAARMFAGESGVRGIGHFHRDPKFPIHCAALLPNEFWPDLAANAYERETEALLKHMLADYIRRYGIWRPVDCIVYGANGGTSVDLREISPEHGLSKLAVCLEAFGQPALTPESQILCVNGCITGLMAVAHAAQRIQAGKSKRVLVVCEEARVRPSDLLKYNAIGALSRDGGDPAKVSRPFSRNRSGFVKGEGAGMLVLEEPKQAEKSGANFYAAVLGAGLTSDAWRLTDGREDLRGMVNAMRSALARADLDPGQIDYINAHGTATPKNDFLETAGIKEVFGRRAYDIPVSSLKSQIGHLNYAAGIVELIACLIMLERQRIAPTVNYDEPDPECDLNYVPNKSQNGKIKTVLKNSFGLGGANASLILGAAL